VRNLNSPAIDHKIETLERSNKMAGVDLTGKRFGMLIVLNKLSNTKGTKWNCLCDCGNYTEVRGSNLTSGATRSCGCLRRSYPRDHYTIHGMANSSERYSYQHAKSRCENPTDPAYPRYGGRGIKFCWNSFVDFYADMGPKPEGLTLERIDNNGPYSKENCKWATRKEQGNNKRNNILITYDGITGTIAYWSDLLGLSHKLIHYRYYSAGDREPERLLRLPSKRLRFKDDELKMSLDERIKLSAKVAALEAA
jgi:hypothetical protein